MKTGIYTYWKGVKMGKMEGKHKSSPYARSRTRRLR